jgi:hypothetical protein
MKIAESKIQQEVVMWFRNNYCLKHHSPRCVIYSVPNESEDAYETQKKINTGLMKGAADLIVLLPGGVTVLPETKTMTGYQSPAQKAFEIQATSLGHVYFVYKSLEQFKEMIKPYLNIAGLEVKNG